MNNSINMINAVIEHTHRHNHHPAAHMMWYFSKHLPGGWWTILGCFVLGLGVVIYCIWQKQIHNIVVEHIKPVVDKL